MPHVRVQEPSTMCCSRREVASRGSLQRRRTPPGAPVRSWWTSDQLRQRQSEGALPDALVIERNVLEWRFDPANPARLAIADYDLQVIVVCQEGYTSSLAAASLQDLGIHRATDVIGGYASWRQLL